MKAPVKTNLAASVRQRLLNLARERRADFQLILIQYAVERLLYRLSRSPYIDRFLLKGAMLFSLWSKEPFRATRDVDFLGLGDSSVPAMCRAFEEICRTVVEIDGLEFLVDSKAKRFAMTRNTAALDSALKRDLPAHAYLSK